MSALWTWEELLAGEIGEPLVLDDRHLVILRPKEHFVGVLEFHRSASGDVCGAADLSTWTFHSLDPLDISPSILCRKCKDHGHIQGGKWVPA